MRNFNFNVVLLIVPPAILWLMAPAFMASSYPAITKGGVIGLYLSLSFIGLYELGYSYISERLSDEE